MKYFILLINAVENSDLNEQISLLLTEKKMDSDDDIDYFKQTIFTKLPPILTISINRTMFIDGIPCKNKCMFPFNYELSVEYSNDSETNSKDYILFSIIVHIGESIESGHYISFVAEFNENGEISKWNEFNDKYVYHVKENRVIDISFGSDDYSSAILFYVSRDYLKNITIFNAAYIGGLIKNYIKGVLFSIFSPWI